MISKSIVEKDKKLTDLPTGWVYMKIEDTGQYINGFAFKPNHRSNEGLPIIRIQNLTNEFRKLNRTTLEVPEDYHVFSGDLLVSWSATLDVFIWKKEKALVNQHIFKVVPNEELMEKALLFYWLKIAIEQLQETEHLHGSTMKHINRGPFMAHQIPLPPKNEQKRIVEKLEELLSDLDAGVDELKSAQAKLVQYRQSLLKSAVEGSLTAEWRTKNAAKETGEELLQRTLKERRKNWEENQLAKFKEQSKEPPKGWKDKYPEPLELDTKGLPDLPMGWVWATVSSILSEIQTGKSFKCLERPPSISEIGVVKVSAVSWGEYDELESKTCTNSKMVNEDLFVKPGDFLFSRANTIKLVGAAVIVENTSLNVMLSDKILRFVLVDELLKKWLLCILRSQFGRAQIEKLATGNQESMRNIGQERIKQIAIPIPPRAELNYILETISTLNMNIQNQTIEIDLNLKNTEMQRKNLLKSAFFGQLVSQNNEDEPASVLLEKIKQKRLEQEKYPKKNNKQIEKVESYMVETNVVGLLKNIKSPLNTADLFKLAGFSQDAESDRVEDFFIELRDGISKGIIDVERKGTEDWFSIKIGITDEN